MLVAMKVVSEFRAHRLQLEQVQTLEGFGVQRDQCRAGMLVPVDVDETAAGEEIEVAASACDSRVHPQVKP